MALWIDFCKQIGFNLFPERRDVCRKYPKAALELKFTGKIVLKGYFHKLSGSSSVEKTKTQTWML